MAEDRKHVMITEGSVTMRYETRSSDTKTRGKNLDDGPVFYNKVQVFNRDLSILMMSLFAQWRYVERSVYKSRRGLRGDEAEAAAKKEKDRLYALSAGELDALLEASAEDDGITILDALAATGLRSIRYAKEVPGVKGVVANDVDRDAADACAKNVAENGGGVSKKCRALCEDAVSHMIASRPLPLENDGADKNKKKNAVYDVVDLDPYGSCVPFLDAAVQCVADGGLLCVTSTDMTVLAGGYPETCYGRYGSLPTKAKYLHENALRIVLNSVETNANKYGRHIVPILSISVDFYVRIFVRVYRKPAEVKRSCGKRAFALQSAGCPSFYLQPIARSVGKKTADSFTPAYLHRTNEHAAAASSRRQRRKEGSLAAADDAPKVDDDDDDKAVVNDDDKAAVAANEEAAVVDDEEKAAVAANEEADDKAAVEAPPPSSPPDDAPPESASSQKSSENEDDGVPPPFCQETGAAFKMVGPIWAGPLHDWEWVTAALDRIESGVDKYLSTRERLHGVLTAVSEELPDVPLYYTLPDICSTLHCQSPKMAEVKAALAHAGYRCSQFHREPDAIKTDAPPRILWDIFRCWCQKHPISEKRLAETHLAHAKILTVAPKLRANFATTAAMRAPKTKARRWAPNPEDHWGPKAAAHGRKRPRHR